MASEFPYLYPHSAAEARRQGTLSDWRDSHKANIACRDAITAAIAHDFDGMYLNADCAKSVIAEFGFKRVNWVLANTLQYKDYDARFSMDNRKWAKRTFIPGEETHTGRNQNVDFVVDSHPAVLDGFVNQYCQAVQELGIFEAEQCIPDGRRQDFEGRVLVLSPQVLKESHWSPQDQLWYATGGFGCNPDSSGRAVYATCLGDGEKTRWNRENFTGILKEELLPDWAQEKLTELQSPSQTASDICMRME
ncbi:hypothetical protein DSECCO2_227070 [anaerobic digester metagenome]